MKKQHNDGLYLRGKTYWMNYTVNGVPKKRSTTTGNQKLAETILEKVHIEIAEGKFLDKDQARNHTWAELREEYLETHSKLNKSTETQKRDATMFKTLDRVFDGLSLDSINSSKVQEFKRMRMKDGVKPGTIKNDLVLLKQVLNFAVEWNWIRYNPIARLKMPTVENKRTRWIGEHENDSEQDLLNACNGNREMADIITFALGTGARESAIMSLKWQDIDFNRATATLIKKSRMGKGKYTIPLEPDIIALLQSKARSLSGYVFNLNGRQYNRRELQYRWSVAIGRTKMIDFHFHDLRHTFATRLIQAGVDIYTVSKLMGHSSIKETERYAHHDIESLRIHSRKKAQIGVN